MSWDTLSWQPVTSEAPDGAGALAHLQPILRSALEEAASALVMGPVTATELSFATATAGDLSEVLLPTSSIELLGTPRRSLWTAIDPAEPSLNGTPVGLSALAGTLIEAFDEVFVELLGEGLSLAVSTSLPDPTTALALFRLGLTDEAGSTVAIMAAVEASVPTELATHVVALEALGIDASKASPSGSSVGGGVTVNDLAAGTGAGVAGGFGNVASPAPGLAPNASQPTSGAAAQVPPVGAPAQPAPDIRPFRLDEIPPVAIVPSSQNIDLLMGVNLQVTVEIGRTKLAIRDVLALTPGSIVELDKLAGEKVDVLVNGQQIAQGEVVVVDENFGVRITDVVSRQRRILSADSAA